MPVFTKQTARAAGLVAGRVAKQRAQNRKAIREQMARITLPPGTIGITTEPSTLCRAKLAMILLQQLAVIEKDPALNAESLRGQVGLVKTIAETCALVFEWKASTTQSLILMDRLKAAKTSATETPSPEPEKMLPEQRSSPEQSVIETQRMLMAQPSQE